MRDISDHDLGRIAMVGAITGMFGLFILVLGMSLVAGVSVGEAVGIALVPTFFGGWFARPRAGRG